MALQLALTAPRVVRSLVMLEPALTMVPSASAMFEAVAPAMDKYIIMLLTPYVLVAIIGQR